MLRKLIGTTLAKNALNGKKPWVAQIGFMGRSWHLGHFRTEEDAGKAYDNAAYHLKGYADREKALNFPFDYTHLPVPVSSNETLNLQTKLVQAFPNRIAETEADSKLTDDERLEKRAVDSLNAMALNVSELKGALRTLSASHRLAKHRLAQALIDIEKRDRVIEGLRAQGNTQFFRPVAGQMVPATPVDQHLTT